jgi:plasmid stabilization system protein ParE
MPTARRTQAAEDDLREIAFHIAFREQRPSTADRIIDELIARCERLAESSISSIQGTAAPEIGDGVRLFAHQRWVIIFRYQPHGVGILRIADSSQDYLSWKMP